MAERVWRDPRATRRYHVGKFRVGTKEGGFVIGSDLAVRYYKKPDWESPSLEIWVPRTSFVTRQELLMSEGFVPELEMEGPPEDVVPYRMGLRLSKARNRVYVDDKYSLARIEGDDDGLDFILASVDPSVNVIPHPPGIDLRVELLNLRAQRDIT